MELETFPCNLIKISLHDENRSSWWKSVFMRNSYWFIWRYSHGKTCHLLNSVQKFIEMQGWLFLTFFIFLLNQVSSFNSKKFFKFFKKLEYRFLVETTKIENTPFLFKVNVKANRMGTTKWTYRKEWSFACNYFIFL